MNKPQPHPTYADSDLVRIVARDYPASSRAEVRDQLASYSDDEHEPLRVRMACLKLAQGDLRALREAVGIARLDYRDVLAPAEYRRYLSARDEAARQRAIDEDWAELQAWLRRA